jgi:16S rRNA (cytidine1402-2'-O)-methyltransferase
MISYWREKEKARSDEIMSRLHAGQSVALISDAGTPGISDPGELLIKKAVEEHLRVVSIPGPSALVASLTVSGLPAEEFTFIGFLPSGKSQRRKVLADLSIERRTLIFYEAPHRVIDTLTDIGEIVGERKASLVKEITKIHEEVLRGSISEILSELKNSVVAGEYVIILEGRKGERPPVTGIVLSEIRALMKKGLGRKEAVKKIADEYGISKKELYNASLHEIP